MEDVDYLKPYLARLGNPSELSSTDAYFMQYTCLNDYKQLLIQRANKILREFDRYSQELIKTQALLTQVNKFSSKCVVLYIYLIQNAI